MRFKLTRDFYIPKHPSQVVRSKHSPAIVYISESTGKSGPLHCAMGFYGKADKPSFNYSFRSAERRAEYVAQWFKDMDDLAKRKQDRKAERKAFMHTLKVGDILKTSWGYDQTNVEYFEVTNVIGKAVEIREISSESQETGFMCGQCVPVPGSYISEPMRKIVQEGNAVKIHSFAYARPLETKVVAGAKVYQPSYWSSYA